MSWDPTPTPRVYYRVYLRNASRGTGWTSVAAFLTSTTAYIGYLRGGDLYEFRVVAENLAGQSPPSNTIAIRIHYALANVSCTDYYFPVGGFPVGWTSVKVSASGVAGASGVQIKITRRLYVNDRFWQSNESWRTTASDGSWSTGVAEHEAQPGPFDRYVYLDLYVDVVGPNGQSWGWAHDQCVGSRW